LLGKNQRKKIGPAEKPAQSVGGLNRTLN